MDASQIHPKISSQNHQNGSNCVAFRHPHQIKEPKKVLYIFWAPSFSLQPHTPSRDQGYHLLFVRCTCPEVHKLRPVKTKDKDVLMCLTPL